MNQRVMSTEPNLGLMNGHAVGRILKETVRRAMVDINTQRQTFEATAKEGYAGNMDDVFTSADTKAQETYLRAFRECFPDWGIIAEEESLRIEPKNSCTVYATVDPLDGTKAFVRRSSQGVGTMVAVVDGKDVISAYIGDINTEEIYGYRPGARSVYRINTRLNMWEKLLYGGGDDLSKKYVLMRDPPERYSQATRNLLPYFKNTEWGGGSIGIWFARLWKREVSAALLTNGMETPWDSTPVVGICKKLGYRFFRPESGLWMHYDPTLPTAPYARTHNTLIIHELDLPGFRKVYPIF